MAPGKEIKENGEEIVMKAVKMEVERKTISVEDAGKMLGVSRQTAYKLVKEGKIPVLKLSPHKFVVPISALEKYLANAGFVDSERQVM
jgi:excisionase family DNA binding protein